MNTNNTVRILIASNPENLRAANPCVTVEAEYGKVLVEGSILTLAHHGDRGDNLPPSLRGNDPVPGIQRIGISHMDLDTLGGILSVMGLKPDAPSFWELSGFVDLNGPHRVMEANPSQEDLDRIRAFWAASKKTPVYPPRDGSVGDVTNQVYQLASTLSQILLGDEDLLQAGRDMVAADADRNASSFLSFDPESGIILRDSTQGFVNDLYTTPDGQPARAVVSHSNAEECPNGNMTASLAMPVEGVHIGNLLGEFFTPECGGHAGIGGTERDQKRPFSDAEAFAAFLATKLA